MKILLAGILGGLAVFLWGFVAHMLLPTGDMGLKTIPNEDAVMSAVRQNVPEPGVYFFPGMDMKKQQTKAEEEAWNAKYRSGPVGLLINRPVGGAALSPRQLVTELVTNILAAFLVSFVLSRMATGYGGRLFASTLFGLFAWISISLSYWTWYDFSNAFTIGELVDQIGGWFVGGLVLAAMAKGGGREVA